MINIIKFCCGFAHTFDSENAINLKPPPFHVNIASATLVQSSASTTTLSLLTALSHAVPLPKGQVHLVSFFIIVTYTKVE